MDRDDLRIVRSIFNKQYVECAALHNDFSQFKNEVFAVAQMK